MMPRQRSWCIAPWKLGVLAGLQVALDVFLGAVADDIWITVDFMYIMHACGWTSSIR